VLPSVEVEPTPVEGAAPIVDVLVEGAGARLLPGVAGPLGVVADAIDVELGAVIVPGEEPVIVPGTVLAVVFEPSVLFVDPGVLLELNVLLEPRVELPMGQGAEDVPTCAMDMLVNAASASPAKCCAFMQTSKMWDGILE
jgi:hypothetical protein